MIIESQRTIRREIQSPFQVRDKLRFKVTNRSQYGALIRTLTRDGYTVTFHWAQDAVMGFVSAYKVLRFDETQSWKASRYVLRPDEVL